MISALGLTILLFIARHVELEHTMEHVEVPLLVFFHFLCSSRSVGLRKVASCIGSGNLFNRW